MYSPHHIAFSVSNHQVSVDFYKQLGFEELSFWQAEDKGKWYKYFFIEDPDGILVEITDESRL